MNRYVGALVVMMLIAAPCQAQDSQKPEQGLPGKQEQQGLMQGQQQKLIGNVNLPPGPYVLTNVRSGQNFYVAVENGQMYLAGQDSPVPVILPGPVTPQQQQGIGGIRGVQNGIPQLQMPGQ